MRIGIPFTGLASLLIGLIQVQWAWLALYQQDSNMPSLFVAALIDQGIADEWLWTMLLSGSLLSVSSLLYRRTLRHIALFLSSTVLLSSFSMFTIYWILTPVTLTLPLMGFYCILLLALDVANKNRHKGAY